MKILQLSENFAVASQITAEDLEEIAASGYRCVICNRPDGEDPGQPTVAELKAACHLHGLELHYVPVGHDSLSHDAVLQQMGIMANAPGPYLAYCRSGHRSTVIWNVIKRMKQRV